jgi:hypothetical protein
MTNVIETPKPVSGHSVSLETITPADVFARVQLLRKELDDIRFEMGKPKSQEVGLLVEGATPHEVFFQAQTLDRKVAQLTLELIGKPQGPEQKWNPGDIHPLHVWKMVDTALRRLLLLKQGLELTIANSEALPDPTTTPTQVFLEIGLALKQLNLLLIHQFSPKDVVEQITLGRDYAKHLLTKFPDPTAPASLPTLERGRTPWDVYYRLSGCYTVLANIARVSKIKMLTLATQKLDRSEIQPNDVYDLATLIVSELAYLHDHLPKVNPPTPVRPSEPTLPSHAYQQAGGLLAQLRVLQRQVQANPTWLQ